MPTLIKPARGRITQGFYDASAAEHIGRNTHYAIDIGWYDYTAGQRDQRVFAAAAGVLRVKPYNEGYGYTVEIDHSSTPGLGAGSSHLGWEPTTFYAHLASRDASLDGQLVAQGQQFGVMGSSGNYTKQTHLHFGFKTRFQPNFAFTWLDPRLYFGDVAGGDVTPIEGDDGIDYHYTEGEMEFLYITDSVDGNNIPGWMLFNPRNGKSIQLLNDGSQIQQDRANSWARFWGDARVCSRQDYLNAKAAVTATL